MRNILTMVGNDLRQRVRDKSVFIFGIIVPLALIYVFNLIFGGIDSMELKPVTVAVAAPEGDQMAAVVPEVLRSASGEQLQVTVQNTPADQVRSAVDSGTAAMGVIIPEGFQGDLVSGAGPEVTVIMGDDGGISGDVVTNIVDGTLAQLTAGTVAVSAAQQLGAAPADLAGIARAASEQAPQLSWQEGEAASEQLQPAAMIVAGQTGMFLLFTVAFGVLGLIIEREWGTLSRILSTPTKEWQVVLAKGLVSFILGVIATVVLLTAGTLLFDGVDFGSPLAVGVLVLLVVAAATSIMFLIAKVARTAEQANIAQAIVAIALGMSAGSFFPVPTTGLVGQLLQINPLTAFVRGLGVTAGGGGVADLGQQVLILIVFIAVCLGVAWLIPSRKDAL